MLTATKRNFQMDLLRVLACFLVIHQHCAEQFYGATGHVEVGDDTLFVGINCALGRISVPLFVMVSGYFLLPMKGTTKAFFKRRLSRILVPFVVCYFIHSVFFMFYNNGTPIDALRDFLGIFINFNAGWGGHLWYIYMLIGLYLLVPVLSPWLERVSKRQLRFYLLIWLLTTLLPYFNRFVNPEMWGACFWNVSPMLYYFTGFVGYFLLGYYVRRFGVPKWIWSVLLILAGYAVTAFFFIDSMFKYTEYADLEISFNFASINVVAMTYGVFCLVSRVKWNGSLEHRSFTGWLGRLLSDFAQRSYGIYLLHILVLLLIHDWLVSVNPDIFSVVTGSGYTFHRIWGNVPAVLVAVPVHAVLTMVAVYLVARLLGLLPKSRQWLGV